VAVSEIALACVATLQGEPDVADRWEQAALRRAQEVGYPRGPFSLAFVKTYAAWIRRFEGDHEASWRLGAEVIAIGQEYGYAFWTALGSTYLATATPGSGPDKDFLAQVIHTLRLMGQEAFAASNLAYLGQLHAKDGDLARAHELLDEALEVVHKTGEYLHLSELLRQRAVYALALGRPASPAVDDLLEAVAVAQEQGAHVARLRAAVALAQVPETARPEIWRTALTAARDGIPASLVTTDVAAADELLAR
jgi:hypothetical protein